MALNVMRTAAARQKNSPPQRTPPNFAPQQQRQAYFQQFANQRNDAIAAQNAADMLFDLFGGGFGGGGGGGFGRGGRSFGRRGGGGRGGGGGGGRSGPTQEQLIAELDQRRAAGQSAIAGARSSGLAGLGQLDFARNQNRKSALDQAWTAMNVGDVDGGDRLARDAQAQGFGGVASALGADRNAANAQLRNTRNITAGTQAEMERAMRLSGAQRPQDFANLMDGLKRVLDSRRDQQVYQLVRGF